MVSGLRSWNITRGKYIPEELRKAGEGEAVRVDLNRPMSEILAQLSQYPVSTRLSLNGTIIVGRDIAHAKLKERMDNGEGLPQYIKDHPIYYAGPAKTPEGYASGSLGPTTAGRMDSYVDQLQSHGGSMIMLAKGNRSQQVTDACKNTVASTSAVLAARQRSWPVAALRALSVLSTRSLAWKLSGKLKSKISRHLSLWMTKEMTSSNRYKCRSVRAASSNRRVSRPSGRLFIVIKW